MLTRATALVIASLAAAWSGCGGGDDEAQDPSPTATAQASASGRLGVDALLAVHDEFVTCVQKQESLGIAAHLSDGRATSDSEGSGGATYDDSLAAPKATAGLVDSETAQYVGLRADTRHTPGTPDVDILIFGAEADAAAQASVLGAEAGASAESAGLFVSVPLRPAKQKYRDASDRALAGCEAEAAP